MKCKIANDEKCNFCKDLPDSLIHIYSTCRITKDFGTKSFNLSMVFLNIRCLLTLV